MGRRKRQAVESGNTRQRLTRRCKDSSGPADVAEPSDAGKPGTTMSSSTRSKRNPRRGAKGKWDEEKLMTSTKSELINLDLVKLLARRDAWDILEESEKDEILSLLPDRIEQQSRQLLDQENPKLPAPPEAFLRYSNHWRDGVRQFQVDLENGRYDPEWICQADEATYERAVGGFDDFKNREFEQFWGQKQTFDKTLAAGESSQIKLKTLIDHGVVRVGDVWKLSRGFNTHSGRLLIEKEAKILKFNDSLMTCVVPAGKRQILPQVPETDFEAVLATYNSMTCEKADIEMETNDIEQNTDADMKTNDIEQTADIEMETNDIDQKADAVPEANETVAVKREQHVHADKEPENNPLLKQKPRRPGRPRKDQQKEVSEQKKADDEGQITTPDNQARQTLSVEIKNAQPVESSTSPSVVINKSATATVAPENGKPTPAHDTTTVPQITEQDTPPSSSSMLSLGGIEVVVLPNVPGITALGNKMIEVDGRIKHIPNGNAWKEFRSYRNNQDMGSLWEVRQAWYMRGK